MYEEVEELEVLNDNIKIAMEDEAKFDGFKVNNKPEGVVNMEKEKDEHLNKANSKIVHDEVINKGCKDTGKITEDEFAETEFTFNDIKEEVGEEKYSEEEEDMADNIKIVTENQGGRDT